MTQKRLVDANELRRMGVPEVFIDTAQYYAEKGAFDVEPSPALLENTIALCLQELRKKPEADLADLPDPVTAGQVAYAQARDSFSEIKGLGRLPAVCAGSVWYSLANAEPPMLIVENHKNLAPSWWNGKELTDVRVACGKINDFAKTLQRPVCSRVVVLKDPSRYQIEELEQISELHQQATSDVYWISARHAGEFAEVDELVVGDQCVLKMTETPSSPKQAVNLLLHSKVEDPAHAITERVRIRDLMSLSVPVKIGGHLCPEFRGLFTGAAGARNAIQMVVGDIHRPH